MNQEKTDSGFVATTTDETENKRKFYKFELNSSINSYNRKVLKFGKKYLNLSLPNIKISSLIDNEMQQTAVKFDLSNIQDDNKKRLSNNKIAENEILMTIDQNKQELSNQCDVDKDDDDDEFISNKHAMNDDVLDSKKLLNKHQTNKQDDESSSHQTGHSGRTLSDTEILGNAVCL